VTGQLHAACRALDQELAASPLAATSSTITQAGVSAAVAWHFTQQMHAGLMPPADYPHLATFSAQAEALPEFIAAPHGDSTYRRS
jgi:hypothetical protein